LVALWLCGGPLYVHMWLGQFTLPLACLLWWSVLAWEAGRPGRALAWWTVGVLWKPAALLWVPVWLRERRLWAGLAAALLLVALNGLYFLRHPADWQVFADSNLRFTSLWVASNVGPAALLYQFTGPGPGYEALRLVSSVALALPALWLTGRRAGRPEFWLLGALWTTLFLVTYKEIWEQHLVLLIPFLVLGLLRRPHWGLWGLALWLLLPGPLVFYDVGGLEVGMDPQPRFSWPVSLLHHSWRAVPLLALYGFWLRQGFAGGRGGGGRGGAGAG
jgi:hypothetical protein